MKCSKEELLKARQYKEDLERQYEEALKEQRVAREKGDLSENAEFDFAKEKVKDLSAKLDLFKYKLSNIELVKTKNNCVSFGQKVRIKIKGENSEEVNELFKSILDDEAESKVCIISNLPEIYSEDAVIISEDSEIGKHILGLEFERKSVTYINEVLKTKVTVEVEREE